MPIFEPLCPPQSHGYSSNSGMTSALTLHRASGAFMTWCRASRQAIPALATSQQQPSNRSVAKKAGKAGGGGPVKVKVSVTAKQKSISAYTQSIHCTACSKNNGRLLKMKKVRFFFLVNFFKNWHVSTYTIYKYIYEIKKNRRGWQP